MVIGVVAACAVLVACGLAVHALRRSRQDAERRLELVLDRLGSQLDMIAAGDEDTHSVPALHAASGSGPYASVSMRMPARESNTAHV